MIWYLVEPYNILKNLIRTKCKKIECDSKVFEDYNEIYMPKIYVQAPQIQIDVLLSVYKLRMGPGLSL